MTRVSVIARQLRDTSAQIARLERAINDAPQERGLQINLSALEKRLQVLEKEYADLTDRQLLDICDYRLIAPGSETYSITAVGNALVTFQQMVTVFFDAIKTGPKIRARISPDVANQANLSFAYSYSGSLGFTMSVPNDRMIAVDSDLDLAIEKSFQVINAREASEIASLARQVGVASVRAAYAWAKQHTKHRLSADITWRRGTSIRNRTTVDIDQLDRITSLIEATSDVTEERISVAGILEGANHKLGTFHFVPEHEGEEIRGRISETLTFAKPLEIPSALIVELRKMTKVHYSTEKEETDWELISWHERD